MTLLLTVFAAIISTVVWYRQAPQDDMQVSTLCWLYWGASIMWLGDAIFGYLEEGAGYFTPAPEAMLNDSFWGCRWWPWAWSSGWCGSW